MNKSCQKKLEKILAESKLEPNRMYLCSNPFTGVSLALSYEEASVYQYIIHWYSMYHQETGLGYHSNAIKAIRNYDKAREVFCYINRRAYRELVD